MFLWGVIPNLRRLIATWKIYGGEASCLYEMGKEIGQQRKAGAQKKEELKKKKIKTELELVASEEGVKVGYVSVVNEWLTYNEWQCWY